MNITAILTMLSIARPSLVIVSVGRSGSTLLTKLVSAIPGSITIIEPYHNHEYVDLYQHRIPASRVPSLQSITDCSVYKEVHTGLVRIMFCTALHSHNTANDLGVCLPQYAVVWRL